MTIELKTAFPIDWGNEYYTVANEVKKRRAPCTCCDNTGKVTIKGEQYECPRCRGNWRDKEVIGESIVYSVAKWQLSSVGIKQRHGALLRFEQTNGKKERGWAQSMEIRQRDFPTMTNTNGEKVYDDYASAMDRVKALNAAERESQKARDAMQAKEAAGRNRATS